MKHEFVILRNGKLETYTRFEDIPKKFDNVIKFNPYMPPPPHTAEDHAEIESWIPRFRELMNRETE
jgi:hypothetical protein